MRGKPSKYDLEKDGQGRLKVRNKETGEDIPAVPVKPARPEGSGRWRIKDGEQRAIYFTEEDIETSLIRKRVETLPKEEKNIRNNVEAAIFQLGYHYRADKSRYRGLAKHKIWAISRCLWVNFRRIAARAGGIGAGTGDALLVLLRFLSGASLSAV
jgi:mRNA-degrading endonuclease RelE of RelBE toxin-antitoxin system